jgi:thiamine-monophosphate kinase
MTLGELGEFGFIERLAARVHASPGVTIGIGDDAAVVTPTPGHVTLVSTDMLVEGIHFDLSYTDPFTLGRKSLAVNLSDIAAMGGHVRHALLSLAVPRTMTLEFLDRFMDGLLGKAAEFNLSLIGGDTCASPTGLVISVTVMGEQLPALVVNRQGARPGDLVFVSGTIGDSALGLKLLRRGETGGATIRHLDPDPRLREGAALAAAGLPSAMIDISDGLLADLGHILRLSGVGADLSLDKLPLSPHYRQHFSRETDTDPFALALAGGEDYELLFTAPPDRAPKIHQLFTDFNIPVTVIGRIVSEGLRVAGLDGSDYIPSSRGFNHFQ